MEKLPVQDQIYDYTFTHDGIECTVRFANPILEDLVTFDLGFGRSGQLTCDEIIKRSFKRKNIVTGQEDIFSNTSEELG